MPFGLRNASQIFQRSFDCVLCGLEFCCAYVIGILIASNNEEEDLQRMEKVFRRLDDNGMVVNSDMCILRRTRETFSPVTWQIFKVYGPSKPKSKLLLNTRILEPGTSSDNSMVKLCEFLGGKRTQTTTYHPVANGMEGLQSVLMSHAAHEHWVGNLPIVLLGIGSSLKPYVNACVAELVYGSTIRPSGELLERTYRYDIRIAPQTFQRFFQLCRARSRLLPCLR